MNVKTYLQSIAFQDHLGHPIKNAVVKGLDNKIKKLKQHVYGVRGMESVLPPPRQRHFYDPVKLRIAHSCSRPA